MPDDFTIEVEDEAQRAIVESILTHTLNWFDDPELEWVNDDIREWLEENGSEHWEAKLFDD